VEAVTEDPVTEERKPLVRREGDESPLPERG